ncbi:MAG: proline dehydrogenase [Planctomycetota bacterium]|nr:MAG: proline dehydrogenase [Planctomycetota bacterium]
MGLFERAVLATLPYVPTPVMRRLASRYIAGEKLEDALARIAGLQSAGHPAIIDVLGEDVRDEAHCREVVDAYKRCAEAVSDKRYDCYVSVKPTHVGLKLSEDLCFALYSELAEHCRARGLFLRVEMEDAPTTDGTLRVFERLRKAFPNVGIVLQSRLFRTPDDIRALAPGPLHVRMVKGIYLEPAAIAHTQPQPIRDAYVACTKLLLERSACISFATHDEQIADAVIPLVEKSGLPREGYEFQVLLGVREALWSQWKARGQRVRVYVPFGPEWRPYSLRRMRKNPQVLKHVIKATLTGG